MKNLETGVREEGLSRVEVDSRGRSYQPVSDKDQSAPVYSGLKLLDETPFRGGTSIRYWM